MAHLDILKVNVGKRSLNKLWRKCTDMMNLKNKCKMVTKACENNHVKFRDLPDCLALHGCRIKERAPKGDS